MSVQISSFRITLVGLGSLAIAMGVGRFSFTPLLPLMQGDQLISISAGGALASFHFLGYWFGAIFAARLPFSAKSALRLSLILIGICTLGMGLTENYYAWLVFRWLCGVCSALTLVLVGNFYIKSLQEMGHIGKQGWVFSGVGAGIALVGLGTLAIMASQIDSLSSWQILGVVTLVIVIVICMHMGAEIVDSRDDAENRKAQQSPLIWSIVIPYAAAGFGYIIPATYLPVMAREFIQSPLVFGWVWPAFGTAAFLSTLFAAWLQKHFSNRQVWAASQIVMAAGLLLPVVVPHILSTIIAGICVGGTFMIITMVGMKEAHRLAPPEDLMRHIAAMTAAFASGQIIGPIFASSIFDLTQGFSLALLIAATILIASVWSLLGKSFGRRLRQN
ncbi:MAG: YbfB/YjiJ family MFS transporter [Gammaproteobacteria bacterium]|nr:YbfB/YjiJ family MFS transporter [Gammaproteobacteria bacterium]